MKAKKILMILTISLILAYCAPSQKKIARENEKNPQYQYEKAIVAMKYDLVDEAIKYLNRALSLDPNHYQSYNLLGLAYFKKKNLAEAASAYQKCLELQPDFSEAHNHLGYVYQEMGFLDKAEEEYKKAYTINNSYDASYNLAKLYFGQNKLELALDYAQKSIQKNSGSSIPYNLQGVILNKMDRYPEAIESFQNSLRIAPNEIITSVNLGIAHLNNREFDKARQLFEKILPFVQDQTLKDKINEYLKIIKEYELQTQREYMSLM